MDSITTHFVALLCKWIFWAWILYQGWRLQLFKHYRLIFTFVLYASLTESFTLFAALTWPTSQFYAYWFLGTGLGSEAFCIAILVSIYFLFDRFRLARDFHLLLVPALLILFEFSGDREVWFGYRLLIVGYAIQNYVGVSALCKRLLQGQLVLGWNLSMVLLALTLTAPLYGLLITGAIADVPFLPRVYWMKFISLSHWLIWAVGMTEYSPPQLVSTRAPEFSVQESLARMRRGIRLLWALLRHGDVSH